MIEIIVWAWMIAVAIIFVAFINIETDAGFGARLGASALTALMSPFIFLEVVFGDDDDEDLRSL